MKHLFSLICIVLLACLASSASAQTGIGTTNPDASARLDVSSSNKGMLIPRVALSGSTDTATVPNPATSLLVYNTNTAGDVTPGFYTWTGAQWERFLVIAQSGGGSNPLTPVGMVNAYAGGSAPDGWLFCNGQPVSRSAYPDLFAAIGTTYGAGDGVNTFNLPDLRGRTVLGAGAGSGLTNRPLGQSGGAETHTLSVAQMPSHNHGGGVHNHSASSGSAGSHNHSASTGNAGNHGHSGSTNTTGSHRHNWYTAHHDRNDSASQGYPAGNNHVAFRSTDRRQRTHDNGTIHANGNHAHSLSINANGNHSHSVSVGSAGGHSHTVSVNNSGGTVSAQGGGQGHNNMQPFAVLNYIIKAE